MASDDPELWKNEGSPLSEAQVIHLEHTIGRKLPDDYRAFLLQRNGGTPRYRDAFRVKNWRGSDNVFGLQCLFGIHRSTETENIDGCVNVYRGRIPKAMLPVGCTDFGDLILLDLNEQPNGVFLWDHENEPDSGEMSNVYRISSSFQSFLESLWEFKLPTDGDLEEAIKKNDVDKLVRCLTKLSDLEERDQWGRTMMERAAIANAVDVISYLFMRGAKAGNALAIAEENLRFFPEHRLSVELLRSLSQSKH